MNDSIRRFRVKYSRRFVRDRRAVMGIPLNLLILVVIAAAAVGIVLTWLYVIPKPIDHLDISPTSVKSERRTTITIKAYDSNNALMQDVKVQVEGAGVDMAGITNSKGEVKVTITPKLPENDNSGFITVTASGGGNTVEESIAVNR